MTVPCPRVDHRTATVLSDQVRSLLKVYVPELETHGEAGQLNDALIGIFARYGEIIIDRVNRAPGKNLFAFLDLIGISPLAPQAARVPLTFYLTAETVHFAVVPALTQVAAELGKGEQKPVIYETERELVVAPVRLESLLLKDAGQDRYVRWDSALGPGAPPAEEGSVLPRAVAEVNLIPHILYIGLNPSRPWPPINQMRLRFVLQAPEGGTLDDRTVRWEICTASPVAAGAVSSTAPGEKPAIPLATANVVGFEPFRDGTENLTKSGDVVFLNLRLPPPTILEGTVAHWFRCRLATPIRREPDAVAGKVRQDHLPAIKSLTAEITFERNRLSIEQAFSNNLRVDVTKDFFPFGEKPRFGDTLYLSSDEAFSNPDALVTLHFTLTNPTDGTEGGMPPVDAHDTKLLWEYWSGESWNTLGTSEAGVAGVGGRVRFVREPEGAPEDSQFSDTTQAFSRSGDVSFRFPKPPVQLELKGQKGYWVRVRIIAGDYGRDAHYEIDTEKGGYLITPPTFAPPSIHAILVDYSVKKESPPDAVLTSNDFGYKRIPPAGEPFRPFTATSSNEASPTLYLGFTLPKAASAAAKGPSGEGLSLEKRFPPRSLSMYFALGERKIRRQTKPESEQQIEVPVWEYWNGAEWRKWTVRDETQGLQRSGLIRVLLPQDAQIRKEFGLDRYWLRMRQSDADFDPQLRRALLNTTLAREGSTIPQEVLGASNGQPNQRFRTTQSPILTGQQLEIREPTLPPAKEQDKIKEEEGEDAIRTAESVTGREEVWVRWHEVANFYGSDPRNRHYVVDRVRGEVLFGDGINGQIPPPLPNNICLRSYRTGGGAVGNKPALVVKQMKTAVPFIDKVVNWDAADGGADAESEAAVLQRGPRVLRHSGRAVTVEDFEDLAKLGSIEVARAKCVPLFDLEQDPDTNKKEPGTVSLVVVPRSADAQPRPTTELCENVREYLEMFSPPVIKLVLVGPEYVEVDVEAVIAIEDLDLASDVELAVTLALQRYLHPLQGGPAGTGWDFGRTPQKSDLYALIEKIEGVSHVRSVQLKCRPLRTGAEKTGRFLICCGKHRIMIVPEE